MEPSDLRGKSIRYPQNPWALLFQAIGIMAFGIILVAWPDITLRVVLVVFGIFAVLWGLFQLFSAYSSKDEEEEK